MISDSAPTFQAFDVFTTQSVVHVQIPGQPLTDGYHQEPRTLVFARNVSDGEPEGFAPQNLTWSLALEDGAPVFSDAPILSTVELEGSRMGVMTFDASSFLRPGIARMQVTLCDSGAPYDPVTGSRHCSIPAEVRVVVRAVNHAPFFLWAREQDLVLYPGLDVHKQVAVNISDGEPWQDSHHVSQNLSFSVVAVHAADGSGGEVPLGGQDMLGLFDHISISSTGCLHAVLAPEHADSVRRVDAHVVLHDDGGTAWGGQDSTLRRLPLFLQPLNPRLAIQAPRNITVTETDLAAHSNLTVLAGLFVPLVPYLGQTQTEQAHGACIASPTTTSDGAYTQSGEPLDSAVVFEVINVTSPEIYLTLPVLSENGDLSFTLAPGRTGTSILTTVLRWKNELTDPAAIVKRGEAQSLPHMMLVRVQALNVPPSFSLERHKTLLESKPEGPSRMPMFVSAISPGRPAESHQHLSFSITFYDTQGIFRSPPLLDEHGTLQYDTFAGAHGMAHVLIQLRDDAGAESPLQRCTIHVLPLPHIVSVNPVIVPIEGNVAITITARSLFLAPQTDATQPTADTDDPGVSSPGSKSRRRLLDEDDEVVWRYPDPWRPPRADNYEQVSVAIGSTECGHVSIMRRSEPSTGRNSTGGYGAAADTKDEKEVSVITCVVGARAGGQRLSVTVTQGALLRLGYGPRVVSSHVLVSGSLSPPDELGAASTRIAGGGYLAVGPHTAAVDTWPPRIGASLADLPLHFIGGGVTALARLGRFVYLGMDL